MVSSEAGMRRREFIGIFGLLGLLGGATLWRHLASLWRPSFGEHAVQTVTAVTDLMFPGEGLPGATALGIHNRIVAMPDFHPMMTDGVAWLDRWATSQGASNFLALDESARLAAVGAAFASQDDDVRQFVVAIRNYGVLNYYSDSVIKAAFRYTGPPQPEGFPDFQDAPK
jgi:hypothetical protein